MKKAFWRRAPAVAIAIVVLAAAASGAWAYCFKCVYYPSGGQWLGLCTQVTSGSGRTTCGELGTQCILGPTYCLVNGGGGGGNPSAGFPCQDDAVGNDGPYPPGYYPNYQQCSSN